MKLSLKLAALIIAFGAFLLPFVRPQIANAAGCQLIISTTEVVAHGSFNATIQNGQAGVEYIIKYDASINSTVFTMPASGSFTTVASLDTIFGPSSPQASSGSFLVTAGTTTPIVPPGEACQPTSGILITVIAPPPPTASITAASTNIAYNTATTLTWTSTNADSCTLNGNPVAKQNTAGQSTGNLTSTTTYTLVCTNVSGNAQSSVTVTVQQPPPPTCSPASQSATTGQTVNFTASGGNGSFSWQATGGSPTSGSGASFSTSYSTAGTKTVTVTSAGKSASCSVTVTAPTPTADIKANGSNGPITIAYNATATLTWTSTNATTCTLNGSTVAIQNTAGQSTGNLTNPTYTYTLSCTGLGGTIQDSVVVNVNPPTPCNYTFTPSTVNSGGTITVTITAGDPAHSFFATIVSGNSNTRIGLGDIPLTAPTVTSDTNYTVAVRDDVTKTLCGGPTALTVTAPLVWHLNTPIVASNQLSVLFSFTPASNGNIALIVDPNPAFTSFPRPFDSGAIVNGTGQVTWNLPPPGTYYAELVYLGAKVSDNVVQFTVSPPAGNTWQLSLKSSINLTAVFSIGGSTPIVGNTVLLIEELPFGDPNKEVPINAGDTTVTWTATLAGTYHAHISYFGSQVSNSAQVTLPVNPPVTQWSLSIQSISGNDVTLNAQCPTADCPGYGGEAVVIIKGSGASQPVPAGGGTVKFTLPNGSYEAVVVVFLSEESGVVNFSLPQKTSCGWLAFPGGAGTVSGPVNNCALASPGGVISALLPYIFGIAGFLSIIIIVISGIQFITSSGNPEAAASARNRLVFALIGLAIIILAFAILQIVDRLFLGGSGVS